MTENEMMKLVCSEDAKKIARHKPLRDVVKGAGEWQAAFDLWVATNISALIDKLKGVPFVHKVWTASDGKYDIDFFVSYGGKSTKFKLKAYKLFPFRHYLKIIRWEGPRSEHLEWVQIGVPEGKGNEVAIGTMSSKSRKLILNGRR